MRLGWAIVVVLVLAVGAALGAAVLAWPRATLGTSTASLARVGLQRFAGRVVAVHVRDASGRNVPVRLRLDGHEVWRR